MITLDLAHLLSSTSEEEAPLRRTLTSISHTVAKSKKTVVVSGAGISCSCGIPDFRSSDGLYNLVKARYPDTFVTGKDLFSSSLFRSPDSTSLFYSFIAELKLAVSAAEPSATHRFIKKLDDKGKLLRSYTQNIDGMEKRLGMRCSSSPDEPAGEEEVNSRASTPGLVPGPTSSQGSSFSSQASSSSQQPFSSQGSTSSQTSSFPSSSQQSYAPISRRSVSVVSSASSGRGGVTMDKKLTKNIQLHGDIHRVRCMVCSASYEFTEEYVEMFREGEAPDCPACEERTQDRIARSKRPLAAGVLRPAIVLYDENHPNGDLIGSIQTHDITRTPDLLLVLGTSLKVHGLKRLVKELARGVHSLPVTAARPNGGRGRVVFVNKTPPQGAEWKGVFDYWVKGECDEWVGRVEEEWRKVKKSDWEVQATLDGAQVVKAAPVGGVKVKKVTGIPKSNAAPKPKTKLAPLPSSDEVPFDLPCVEIPAYCYTSFQTTPSSPLSSPPLLPVDLPPSSPPPGPPLSPSKRSHNSSSRPSSSQAGPLKKHRSLSNSNSGERGLLFGQENQDREEEETEDEDTPFGSPMKVDVKGKGKAKAIPTLTTTVKAKKAVASKKTSLPPLPSLGIKLVGGIKATSKAGAATKGKAGALPVVVQKKVTSSMVVGKQAGAVSSGKKRLGVGRPPVSPEMGTCSLPGSVVLP